MSVYYRIEHTTRFHYSQPVTESLMEVYMQPRTEGNQRCLRFTLRTSPHARIQSFADPLQNIVHFFDIPYQHSQLILRADSLVETAPLPQLPDALSPESWEELDKWTEQDDYWDMLAPSNRVQNTVLLRAFAEELAIFRRDDPLTLLREINSAIYDAFDYMPDSTAVDSPIDDALASRKGVCQDYAHIMIALVRGLGIPCRYVSGYLFYKSDRSTPDQSHAWIEAFLPTLGWIGFDPTNNILVGERHIRVALGRDYDDVPPTKGIFKGVADSELSVEVHVSQVEAPAGTLVTREESPQFLAPIEAEHSQQQ